MCVLSCCVIIFLKLKYCGIVKFELLFLYKCVSILLCLVVLCTFVLPTVKNNGSKVKIKCESFSQDQRVKLPRIVDNFDIKCSKLFGLQNVPNECIAILHSIVDVDQVFVENCLDAFATLDCFFAMPPN